MSHSIDQKAARLRRIVSGLDSCVVAFSGGVDSAYLAVMARDVLGERALAVTAQSPSYSRRQREVALDIVGRYGLSHEFIRTGELDDPDYAANPVNRCFFCKNELYSRLRAIARDRGFNHVIDGNNMDDTSDFRPGRAAGESLEVRSPLIEASLGKAEVRELSRLRGLPTWDLPASACLASRIPYGSPVTEEKLEMIERGEEVMRALGFRQSRVRHHGDVARIEIARDELESALSLEVFERLSAEFKSIGFRYVTLDLDGYRSGALNEGLARAGGGDDALHAIQVRPK